MLRHNKTWNIVQSSIFHATPIPCPLFAASGLCVPRLCASPLGQIVDAVQSKPTPQLSPKGVIGAGHCAKWNDAEPVYCADDRPPCGYTLAPKSIGVRDVTHLVGLGSLHPETTTSPKSIGVMKEHEITRELHRRLDKRKQYLLEDERDHLKDKTCNLYRAAIKKPDHPFRQEMVKVEKPEPKKHKQKKKRVTKRNKVSAKDFYNSHAWKKARYRVLRSNDGRCELCGLSKHDGVTLHVDHIKPRSTHPELELRASNLQVLCGPCNEGKWNFYDDDWRAKNVTDISDWR